VLLPVYTIVLRPRVPKRRGGVIATPAETRLVLALSTNAAFPGPKDTDTQEADRCRCISAKTPLANEADDSVSGQRTPTPKKLLQGFGGYSRFIFVCIYIYNSWSLLATERAAVGTIQELWLGLYTGEPKFVCALA
jgi:hypothetical protein